MQPAVEGFAVPDHHVHGGRHTPERAEPPLCQTVERFGGPIDQDEQVVVAVWPGLITSPRAKEVNPVWM